MGPEHRGLLRAGRRWSARGHDHRLRREDTLVARRARQRDDGARLRVRRLRTGRSALSVRRHCATRAGGIAASFREGLDPRHRHRLRGHRPRLRGDEVVDDASEPDGAGGLLRSSSLRHVRIGGGFGPGARSLRGAHQLRARPRGRVHRRHVPGTRGGCLAALVERRHGERTRSQPRRCWRRRGSGQPSWVWKASRDSPTCTVAAGSTRPPCSTTWEARTPSRGDG